MTTIVADARAAIMACDSRVQIDGQWWPGTKIYRVGDMLIGGAGDTAAINKAIEWLRKGRKGPPPKQPDEFCLLSLGPGGVRYWSHKLDSEPVDRGFHAIGSGGNAALGAMLHGASAKEAVEIAREVDTATGGDVVVIALGPQG